MGGDVHRCNQPFWILDLRIGGGGELRGTERQAKTGWNQGPISSPSSHQNTCIPLLTDPVGVNFGSSLWSLWQWLKIKGVWEKKTKKSSAFRTGWALSTSCGRPSREGGRAPGAHNHPATLKKTSHSPPRGSETFSLLFLSPSAVIFSWIHILQSQVGRAK